MNNNQMWSYIHLFLKAAVVAQHEEPLRRAIRVEGSWVNLNDFERRENQ